MHRNTLMSYGTKLCGALVLASLSVAAFAKESLEQRVQKMEDMLAIKDLLAGAYPKALDSSDWKAYAALFTEDGELKVGASVMKGPKAIEENFSKPRTPRPRPAAEGTSAAGGAAAAPSAPATRPINKHIVTDFNYKIDGDTATGTAYWETVSTRDGKTTIAGAGHYVDVLKKVNGVWKFQFREIANGPIPGSAAAAQ
jgi:hypothetical protein